MMYLSWFGADAAVCGTVCIALFIVLAFARRKRRIASERVACLRDLVSRLRMASVARDPQRRRIVAATARLIRSRAERWGIHLSSIGTNDRELDRRTALASDPPRPARVPAGTFRKAPARAAAAPTRRSEQPIIPIGEQTFDLSGEGAVREAEVPTNDIAMGDVVEEDARLPVMHGTPLDDELIVILVEPPSGEPYLVCGGIEHPVTDTAACTEVPGDGSEDEKLSRKTDAWFERIELDGPATAPAAQDGTFADLVGEWIDELAPGDAA